jgi:hypothetical protein
MTGWVYQDVLGFDISMGYTNNMQVAYGFKHLVRV